MYKEKMQEEKNCQKDESVFATFTWSFYVSLDDATAGWAVVQLF